jgi:CheY-like chemotaxis protein
VIWSDYKFWVTIIMNRRVLLVEDDLNLLSFFRDVLSPDEQAGIYPERFDVAALSDGQAAYEMVKKSLQANQPYAVAFIDMRMPGWNGLFTAEKLRSLDDRIFIVIVTAYSDATIVELQQILKHDVFYLCKPISPDELYQMAWSLCTRWDEDRGVSDTNHSTPKPASSPNKIITVTGITEETRQMLNHQEYRIKALPFYIGRMSCTDGGEILTDHYFKIKDVQPYKVSKDHLSINYSRGQYYVLDRGSNLGTILNGRLIGGKTNVYKSNLRVGNNTLIVGNKSSPYQFCISIK